MIETAGSPVAVAKVAIDALAANDVVGVVAAGEGGPLEDAEVSFDPNSPAVRTCPSASASRQLTTRRSAALTMWYGWNTLRARVPDRRPAEVMPHIPRDLSLLAGLRPSLSEVAAPLAGPAPAGATREQERDDPAVPSFDGP